jgi:hypothetical protein
MAASLPKRQRDSWRCDELLAVTPAAGAARLRNGEAYLFDEMRECNASALFWFAQVNSNSTNTTVQVSGPNPLIQESREDAHE